MEKGCKGKVKKLNLKGDEARGKGRKKSVAAEGKEGVKGRNGGSVSPINSRLGRNKENLARKKEENPPDVFKIKVGERKKKKSEGVLLNITKGSAKNWTAVKASKPEKVVMKKGGNRSQGLLGKIHTNRLNSSKIIKKCFKPTEDSFKTPENKSFQIEKSKLLSDPKLKLPEIGYFCKKVAPLSLPFCLNSVSLIDNKTEESFIACNPFSLAGALDDHETSIEARQEINLRTHFKNNSVPERFTFDTFPYFEEENKIIDYSQDEIAVVNSLETHKTAINNELTAGDSGKSLLTPKNHRKIMHEFNAEEKSGVGKFDFDLQNFTEESFMSPPRVMKTFYSPDSNTKHQHEPKAPRKFYTETDSPGSFNFSLSSSSEFLNDPSPIPQFRAKDQGSQTDLLN